MKKSLRANLKHQYRVSQYREHYFSSHNENNGDYYEYLSLSRFVDEF